MVRRCRADTADLYFGDPVTHVYRPLDYAWRAHARYLRRFGAGAKRVLFLGMNPGPWGMAQTGVPFGEVAAVRDWLGIEEPVHRPDPEHPRRPIEGFACARSEVSGRRLWGLFAARFGTAAAFFAEHLVLNYCPLVFMEETGRNRTPDRLPAAEAEPLFAACDRQLTRLIAVYQPRWVLGIGGFAEKRLRAIIGASCSTDAGITDAGATDAGATDAGTTDAGTSDAGTAPRIGKILHPSPASPAANRGWAKTATRQLQELGIW